MPQRARLKIHGQGGVEVALVRSYLEELEATYNSILAFEIIMDSQTRLARDFPDFFPFRSRFGLLLGRDGRPPWEWPATLEQIDLIVPNSEVLVLKAVQLASPGFWEFVGNLNPLEVLRKYLQDRHERRKDKDYRESAERRRLELENLQRENEVIAGRIRIAKEMGATDRDLAPLINSFIGRPLRRLNKYQDNGIIDQAELSNDSMKD